jgi:hypothetical protein
MSHLVLALIGGGLGLALIAHEVHALDNIDAYELAAA